MSIVIVMPSRGRPARAWQAVQAIRDTAVMVSTSIVLAVDADDPELEAYRALRWPGEFRAETSLVVLEGDTTGDLVRATNTVARRIADEEPEAIIGNLGDDHLCRTPDWDRRMAGALRSPGIAYGDDGLQGPRLPTAPFISASIVRALGWYFLPTLTHLWVDNVIYDLGERTGILHYRPDVVIEHMHPLADKAEWDDGYRRANGDATIARDRGEYHAWRRSGMEADLRQLRAALGMAAA